MRSPAAAIAWEFRQRHRWGLTALAGYLILLAIIKLAIVVSGQLVTFQSTESFALVVVVPITTTFMYFLAVFSYGLSGDLAARESMYPARMFTLPVTTGALAGWPMLYGTVAMAILWLATRLLCVWPSEFGVPMIWPGLLAASLLAWTQALTWMPYPLPGLRVIVTVLWLVVIDAIVMVALEYKAPEPVMLAILAPHVPLAHLAARYAVARGRRGDVPDWRGLLPGLARIRDVVARRRDHFASPARAHMWFEWRRHGRSLPALVGILLPFELGLLFLIESPALIFFTLLGVVLTPPFMAGFVAGTVSRPNPHARDSYGVSPFVATRPLSTAALIAAPLKATIWSTAAAWVLVLAGIPLALILSGTWPVVIERASRFREAVGTPRAITVALLGCAGLVAWTWKRLVQGLYVGLTGREWLIKGHVFLSLSLLSVAGPLLYWIGEHTAAERALYDAWVWIVAILVCVKMSAAAWIVTRLYHSRLLRDRTLVTGAACWCAAVLALYGLLVWLVDMPFFPHYVLGLVAILAIPLARLSAAPLALAWNRHR
jgi:hypothetical protein